MTWVKIFDASGSWPNDPAACWADGYRAIAGYAGAQSWKTLTGARLAKWRTPAHPFAIAPMYESAGTEPIDSPSDGTSHARAARAAWRDLGIADDDAIAYAVDRNVSLTQIKGPVARYFELVGKTDTCLPIAYLENDGVEWLASRGLIAGGFIPAAFSWGNPARLAVPGDAPAHALWLQEHNGYALHGGSVDIGHILTTAPIWWPGTSHPAEDDMALTPDDYKAIAAEVVKELLVADVDPSKPGTYTLGGAIFVTLQRTGLLNSLTPAAIATSVTGALATLPNSGWTQAQLAEVEQAVAAVFGKVQVSVAP